MALGKIISFNNTIGIFSFLPSLQTASLRPAPPLQPDQWRNKAASSDHKFSPQKTTNQTLKFQSLKILILFLVVISTATASCLTPNPARADTPLKISDNGSTAGFVTVTWADSVQNTATTNTDTTNTDKNNLPVFQLQLKQQSQTDTDYKTIYQGKDNATTLSGLQNGTYNLRVKSAEGPWSPPLNLTIKHHSLQKALSFFVLGLVLFFALLALVFSPLPKSKSE